MKYLYYLNDNMHKKEIKLLMLLTISLVFSIIYYFIPDSEFGGINKFQEILREELIKKKIINKLEPDKSIENFQNFKVNYNNNIQLNPMQEESDALTYLDDNTEKELNKQTYETTKLLKNQEFKSNNFSIYQKIFDRLYFAIVTGTTLGYGDVYPNSNRTKILAMIQLLLTISLIIL